MKWLIVLSAITASHVLDARPISEQQQLLTPSVPQSLRDILNEVAKSPATKYPTDLTRDIIPKPIHSHNDYWRDLPFFNALSVGCESIEADVWLYNETLYVGHQILALTPERTFDSLYIQPILRVLSRQNPTGLIAQTTVKNGVFDAESDQTLYLWVDVKQDGAEAWPYVIRALEPLRRAGYLTTVNGSSVTKGAVTVIGTGEAPLDQIQGLEVRDYFYDANIALLNTTQSNLSAALSPIASGDFNEIFGPIKGGSFNSTQLATLKEQVKVANSRGIGVRYWETPSYPISTRNAVWDTLMTEGVILINADDLTAAATFMTSA